MKVVKYFFICIGITFALVLLVSLFLPDKAHLERSTEINADAEVAFNMINDLKRWEEWSPWHKPDSLTHWQFSEFTVGEGSWYTWNSNNTYVGKGKLTIIESKPNCYIKTKMDLDGMGTSYAEYIFTPNETGGFKLTWTMDINGEGIPWYFVPFSRYFNLFIENTIGPDYEKGLSTIKKLSETTPKLTIAGFDASVKVMAPLLYISERRFVGFADVPKNISEIYSNLMMLLQQQNTAPAGAPFTINYKADVNGVDMEAALPVSKTINVSAPVNFSKLNAGKCLVVAYKGSYNSIGIVYQPALQWIKDNNYVLNGAPMEFYVTDPMLEKDSTKWLTEVVFPIK
jgi:effector-binding domain-containing protein